jgi:phosphatidylinositol alpha-1,6-mannosyltransferase
MTRVLIVTPDFPPAPGGIQLVMSRLAENLDAEVHVVTLAFEGRRVEPSDRFGLTVAGRLDRGGNKLANARLNAAALRQALRRRPDVVISGHAVAAPAAAAIRGLRGARVLQYVHADEARQRPGLLSRAVRKADAVIAVSSYARELVLGAGGAPERIHVIHPGVDQPATSATAAQERAARPTLITVARMQMAYKGHDTIIRALPEIRERVPDVRWVVVGDGSLREDLGRLAAELGVEDAIEFAGHVSDSERDRMLGEADVFAMPSRLPEGGGGEGFGIVFLEAACHGLPVVAGNVGGAVDAVVDGETGLLVDPTDPPAVAGAVIRLLTDPGLAERLGQAGLERARGFTWPRHAAAVAELFEERSSP